MPNDVLHPSILHSVYCFTCMFSRTPPINRDVGDSQRRWHASNQPSFALRAYEMKSLLPLFTIRVSYPRAVKFHINYVHSFVFVAYIIRLCTTRATRAQMRNFRPCKSNRHLSFCVRNLRARNWTKAVCHRRQCLPSTSATRCDEISEWRVWEFCRRAQRKLSSRALHKPWFKLTARKTRPNRQ